MPAKPFERCQLILQIFCKGVEIRTRRVLAFRIAPLQPLQSLRIPSIILKNEPPGSKSRHDLRIPTRLQNPGRAIDEPQRLVKLPHPPVAVRHIVEQSSDAARWS